MYIPKDFILEDKELIFSLMRQYPLATVISTDPVKISHLPLVVKPTENKILGHLARANDHWRFLAEAKTTCVFQGPSAYITPSLYSDKQSVPTYNYIAIHIVGTCQIIESDQGKEDILKETINMLEPAYDKVWQNLPDDYKGRMLKGIIAFSMDIISIEAKAKLSQNKDEVTQAKVAEYLRAQYPDMYAFMQQL